MKLARWIELRGAYEIARGCAGLLGLLVIAIAAPGCPTTLAPAVASVAGGGLAMGEMAGIKASEKASDRHVPGPRDEQDERCDALAADPPGLEEVRLHNGVIESREWILVPGKKQPAWEMITEKGADAKGWAPKPNIAHLAFKPTLNSLLDADEPQFLAYAPFTVESVADSRKMNIVREAFGPEIGTFKWRGREYGFTLVKQLPCFKPTL
jgi:hypothetical protein